MCCNELYSVNSNHIQVTLCVNVWVCGIAVKAVTLLKFISLLGRAVETPKMSDQPSYSHTESILKYSFCACGVYLMILLKGLYPNWTQRMDIITHHCSR